jgi:hypothetical protein
LHQQGEKLVFLSLVPGTRMFGQMKIYLLGQFVRLIKFISGQAPGLDVRVAFYGGSDRCLLRFGQI